MEKVSVSMSTDFLVTHKPTSIPKVRLNSIQTITMGANVLAILVVPKGWMTNTSTKIPHEMPTTADVNMFGLTTVILQFI